MSGGNEVDPNSEYTFIIRGKDAGGGDIYCDAAGTMLKFEGGAFTPTPRSYAFAPGAIVDFDVTL
jgi:hypothetical protein